MEISGIAGAAGATVRATAKTGDRRLHQRRVEGVRNAEPLGRDVPMGQLPLERFDGRERARARRRGAAR